MEVAEQGKGKRERRKKMKRQVGKRTSSMYVYI